jgi:hypothetical protein
MSINVYTSKGVYNKVNIDENYKKLKQKNDKSLKS